jgi:hypothetical protein
MRRDDDEYFPPFPPSLIAYSLRREEAERLAEVIERVLIREDRGGHVSVFAPSRPLKRHRGIDVLPALLRVSAWTGDYEILWQGPTFPPEELIAQWGEEYERNADLEAQAGVARLETERQTERLRAEAPRTFEEAVDRLANQLQPSARQRFAAMTEKDLIRLHFTFGMWIRNAWLWTNPTLVAACGCTDPDYASGVLIRALWRRVRADSDGT